MAQYPKDIAGNEIYFEIRGRMLAQFDIAQDEYHYQFIINHGPWIYKILSDTENPLTEKEIFEAGIKKLKELLRGESSIRKWIDDHPPEPVGDFTFIIGSDEE